MNFREFAEKSIVILDGAMGSMLERRGMQAGERSEMRSLTHPDQITEIHRLYYESGASVVNTNTFGCSPLRYSDDELRELVGAAVRCAEAARSTARGVGRALSRLI